MSSGPRFNLIQTTGPKVKRGLNACCKNTTHTRGRDHVLRTIEDEIMPEMTSACPNTHGAGTSGRSAGDVDLSQSKVEPFWTNNRVHWRIKKSLQARFARVYP